MNIFGAVALALMFRLKIRSERPKVSDVTKKS
jgi:hypothetical protein